MLDDAPAGFPYRRRVTNALQARKAVRDLKRLGVDFIKVHDHTPREVFFAIADEAPKVGLTFAGHVPMLVTVSEAADAGLRSIEHLADFRVFEECSSGDRYSPKKCAPLFEKLAAKDVWETPTMESMQTLPDVFSGAPLPHSEYASDSLLAITHDNVRLSHLDRKSLDNFRATNRISLQPIHDLLSHGNRFLAVCDALVPGFCLHDELEWLTRAGFTPLESLQTATINPARFLGREAFEGTVETGKRANLVLLQGDPTLDIHNTKAIEAVIIKGKLLTKPTLGQIIARHRRPNN
jgi:Amidohydrolase family